jgi:hypothetical protein
MNINQHFFTLTVYQACPYPRTIRAESKQQWKWQV